MSIDTTAQWKVIYDRLDKSDVGDVTPYAELQTLLPDTQWKGVVAAFHQARKRFVAAGIDFENVRGEGYRKVTVSKAKAKVPLAEKVTRKPAAPKAAAESTKAVAFIAASTPASKPVKPLTSAQRIEALESQVEFLTSRLEEVAVSAKQPASRPAPRPAPRKR